MKREVIFLLIILAMLPIVNAQEIKIFGQSYPLILVVPIFFMALIVLIFLLVIIKDSLSNFHLPKFHFKSSKKENIEKNENSNLSLRLNDLINKVERWSTNDYLNQFSNLFREYLKNKYDLKQELIFEDLPKTVKSANKTELEIADKLVKLRYSGVEVGKKDLYYINDLLIKLVQPVMGKKEGKASFFKKLFSKKEHKEISPIIKKEPKVVVLPKKEHKPFFKNIFISFKRSKILKIISEAKSFIYNNPLKSRRLFGQALLRYHKLKVKEDKQASDSLNEFIKESLKKYPNEKHFFDLSKKIIALKHSGNALSQESLRTIIALKNLIKSEEILASAKLKEFSKKLNLEEQKLKHFSKKKELPHHSIGKEISSSIHNLENNIVKAFHVNKNLKSLEKDKKKVLENLKKLPEAPSPSKEGFLESLNKKFTNYEILHKKNNILKLLEKASSALKDDIKIAKQYYGQALLDYYKLPVKKDDLVYSKIMKFHDDLFRYHEDKPLVNVSKDLIKLKHAGNHITPDSLNLINKFGKIIKKEENLIFDKFKEHRLEKDLIKKAPVKPELHLPSPGLSLKLAKTENNIARDLTKIGRSFGNEIKNIKNKEETFFDNLRKSRKEKEHQKLIKEQEIIKEKKYYEDLIEKVPEHPKLELPKPSFINRLEEKSYHAVEKIGKVEDKFLKGVSSKEREFMENLRRKHEEKIRLKLLEQKRIDLERKKEERERLQKLKMQELKEKELRKEQEMLKQKEDFNKLIQKTPLKPELQLPKPPESFVQNLGKEAPQPIKLNYNLEIKEKPQEVSPMENDVLNLKVIRATQDHRHIFPDLEPKDYTRKEMLRYYASSELPKQTKIKQVKKVLPMPTIEIVKNFKPSKTMDSLRKEEQEIYEKLSKLNNF